MKNLIEIIEDLNPYFDIIYDNEESFLNEFAQFEFAFGVGLIEVSFGDSSVKFVYVMDSGASIAYDVKFDDFIKWVNKINLTDKK